VARRRLAAELVAHGVVVALLAGLLRSPLVLAAADASSGPALAMLPPRAPADLSTSSGILSTARADPPRAGEHDSPRRTSPHASATPSPHSDVPREASIRGEVVETACFVMAGRRGDAHKQCALACVHAGQNLGVVDDATGVLHLVVQDRTSGEAPNPLLDHVAEKVEVRGTLIERGGLQGIIIHSVRSLEPAPAAK